MFMQVNRAQVGTSAARTPGLSGRPAASSAWYGCRRWPASIMLASTWAAPRPTCRAITVRARLHDPGCRGRLRAPMLDIHTVAAGGRSVTFDGAATGRPGSAGADPGPAATGPLCVTRRQRDILHPVPTSRPYSVRWRPATLDARTVRRGFTDLAADIAADRRRPVASRSPRGYLRIAVANMANAVKDLRAKGRRGTR